MRLKILPSSLREPQRYLAVEIISEKPLEKNDIVSIIWNACLRLHGECETSKFKLWLIKTWTPLKDGENYKQKCIIRCKRGEEEKVRAALSSTYQHDNKRVALHTIGISGTIRSATQKFIKLK
ncbi:MAG: Rpp14/Pop5 family protein [Methanothermobacter sp.]|nr:Rpp14/Pop5 family protein [Methanothermobacter sp.]